MAVCRPRHVRFIPSEMEEVARAPWRGLTFEQLRDAPEGDIHLVPRKPLGAPRHRHPRYRSFLDDRKLAIGPDPDLAIAPERPTPWDMRAKVEKAEARRQDDAGEVLWRWCEGGHVLRYVKLVVLWKWHVMCTADVGTALVVWRSGRRMNPSCLPPA